jgi:hypothetical protein
VRSPEAPKITNAHGGVRPGPAAVGEGMASGIATIRAKP